MGMLREEKRIILHTKSRHWCYDIVTVHHWRHHGRILALLLLGSATALCGSRTEKVFAAKEQQLWKHQTRTALEHSIRNDLEDARGLWRHPFTCLPQHLSLIGIERCQCLFVLTLLSPPHLSVHPPLLVATAPALSQPHAAHGHTTMIGIEENNSPPEAAGTVLIPSWLHDHLPSSTRRE